MEKYRFTGIWSVFIFSLLLFGCRPSTNPQMTPISDNPSLSPGDAANVPSTNRIKIRWFIGVGTGRTPEAVETASEFVKEFNQSQDKIELELEVITSSTHDAIDRLLSELEAGNPPDLVAPADKGWAGEQLSEYILPFDTSLRGNELSEVDSKVLNSWRVEGKLIGLPIGVFPSAIYYNKSIFDAAKLPYPPHKFGEPYADGDPWTIEKMEEIAMQLTLDTNHQNAASLDFDPAFITQWGFHWQWDSTRSMAVMFGPGSVVGDNGNAVIPQNWQEAYRWYYEGTWEKHFIPTNAQVSSMMNGNPFRSGRVAMIHSFMWYSPRLVDLSNWDLAAVPAWQGISTTRMELDGVIILNTTQHPAEAVKVAYAIANSPELLLAWEMIPTSKGMQAQFIDEIKLKHPGVDWQVMLDSIDYADSTYENMMPNYRKAYDRLLAFRDLIGSSGDLSLDQEIDRLEADLQAIFDENP